MRPETCGLAPVSECIRILRAGLNWATGVPSCFAVAYQNLGPSLGSGLAPGMRVWRENRGIHEGVATWFAPGNSGFLQIKTGYLRTSQEL